MGTLLQSEESLSVLNEDWRPWNKIREGTEESKSFYTVHERHKQVTQNLTLAQTLIIPRNLTLTPNHPFSFSHRLIFRSYELTKHGKTWCVMQKC